MKEMQYNIELENKIIKRINDLYITERKQYLILNNKGEYYTSTKGKNSYVNLHDELIRGHLRGDMTVGVFSGKEVSKFICFDIDMDDKNNKVKLKWIYYLLKNALNDIGINDEYIHIAHSGNKGIHLLIYCDNTIPLSHFKDLFKNTMLLIQQNIDPTTRTIMHDRNELVLELIGICKIEFRPNGVSQGVKLELGINFKNEDTTTNKCLFMDKDTFTIINSNKYILTITQIPKDELLDLINVSNDNLNNEINIHKKLIKENIKEPHSHKINRDEDATIAFIVDLLSNGMNTTGSRNNSIFKISKYFLYMGLDESESLIELKEWMTKQDKKYYSITLEEALFECERVNKMVYEKGYKLVGNIDNLYLHKQEMIEVMKVKDKNAKIILFALLLHSNRYKVKNDVFYMTFKQLEEMTGLGIKASRNNIKSLEEMGLIEVVERNIKQSGTCIKKPNKYKVTLNVEEIENDVVLEIDNTSSSIDYLELYYASTIKLLTNKEISHLPKRQSQEFRDYRKLVS